METFFRQVAQPYDDEFKSYYVVWKPEKRLSIHPQTRGFKSYYVVWKRCNLHFLYEK